MNDLDRAVAEAIERGQVEFRRLRIGVTELLQGLAAERHHLARWLPARRTVKMEDLPPEEKLLRTFLDEAARCQTFIDDLCSRQEAALPHIHVPFFGRTGNGKSALMAALGCTDGAGVSPGETDFTVEIAVVEYGNIRLVDAPGIEGPGDRRTREELEAWARHAGEVADLVLIVFNTLNQQVGEFRKTAQWIRALGKPVLVLLNVQEAGWRQPVRTPDRATRLRLTKMVRDHVTHIRAELAKIGLEGAPIIALHAKLAMFGRIQEPYRGPDLLAKSFRRNRDTFGAERLTAWSNLPALEELLTTLFWDHALELRIGMLREEVRGALGQTAARLRSVGAEAAKSANGFEVQIAALFLKLGPLSADERRALEEERVPDDLLSELQRLRGKPFAVPPSGDLEILLEQLLAARLDRERDRAATRAAAAIEAAFEERRTLSGSELVLAALPSPDALANLMRALIEELTAGLVPNLPPTTACPQPTLHLNGVDGHVGAKQRQQSWLLQVAGLILRAVTLHAKTAQGVALREAGAAAFKREGSKRRQTAESLWLKARSTAIANARQEVASLFATLHEAVRGQVLAHRTEWAFPRCGSCFVRPWCAGSSPPPPSRPPSSLRPSPSDSRCGCRRRR